jgi:putative hydrolase of the HAD superfamily
MTAMIDLVAFDGDDTLWHSESEFAVTQQKLRSLLEEHCDPAELDARLIDAERGNLELYGYGAKAFTLSVIETAVELLGDRLTGADVRAILDIGKELLRHPVALLDGAAEAVAGAAEHWPVVLVTKGDLFHQESKVARSGLGDLFSGVEIVGEKDPAAYERVCRRHGIAPDRLVMIGNSLRSDAAPVLDLGGWAVHVPYELTWELEQADDEAKVRSAPRFRELGSLADVPALLSTIATD